MNTSQAFKFCGHCGGPLQLRVPDGDRQLRTWCDECQIAHYRNPTMLVGVLLYCGRKLFWAQRGIEPARGKWAFPAGFLEQGESLQEGAARELREETGLEIAPAELIPMSISSLLSINQVYMVFRCKCDSELSAAITEETRDWGWFERSAAPWMDMAYPETTGLVEQVYDAIESGEFFMRIGQIGRGGSLYQVHRLTDR